MRIIGNLPIPKESNVKYPFGANIQNETDTLQGTPVIEEVFGDLFMNIYKLLELTGITPTDTQDNNLTQYQLVEAFKKLPNVINDVEHEMTLIGTIFNLPIEFEYLPNNFVCFAKALDSYDSGISYTIKGTGLLEHSFSSLSGFNSGDTLILIFRSGNVEAITLNVVFDKYEEIALLYGLPLSFNSSNSLYFFNDGILVSNTPLSYNIQDVIRFQELDSTLEIVDVFKIGANFICSVIKPSDNTYFKVFSFKNYNFETAYEMSFSGFTPSNVNTPYLYTDGVYLYVTNKSGTTVNDYDVDWYAISVFGDTLYFVSHNTINNGFLKSTNAIVKSSELYVLELGGITKYNLNTSFSSVVLNLGSVTGQLFLYFGIPYFSNGSVARQILL